MKKIDVIIESGNTIATLTGSQKSLTLFRCDTVDQKDLLRANELKRLLSKDEFWLIYTNYHQFVAQPDLCFDPDKYAPTIIDVAFAYGENIAIKYMVCLIDYLASSCGQKNGITDNDLVLAAKELMLQPRARTLKVTEWIWFAYAFRMSELGITYGTLTIKAITEAFQRFLIYRREKIADIYDHRTK